MYILKEETKMYIKKVYLKKKQKCTEETKCKCT